MRKAVLLVLLLVALPAFFARAEPSEFEKKCKELGLIFTPPENYVAVPPKDNRDMKYDYALRHPTKNYEVRYAVRPFPKGVVEAFQEWTKRKDKGQTILTDPNLMFEANFRAIMVNVAGQGETGPPQRLAAESVKAEFGGDAGMLVPTECDSEFGSDFKVCLMVGIHKNNFGQIYIFHLYNDKEAVEQPPGPAFYSLRFATAEKR